MVYYVYSNFQPHNSVYPVTKRLYVIVITTPLPHLDIFLFLKSCYNIRCFYAYESSQDRFKLSASVAYVTRYKMCFNSPLARL